MSRIEADERVLKEFELAIDEVVDFKTAKACCRKSREVWMYFVGAFSLMFFIGAFKLKRLPLHLVDDLALILGGAHRALLDLVGSLSDEFEKEKVEKYAESIAFRKKLLHVLVGQGAGAVEELFDSKLTSMSNA